MLKALFFIQLLSSLIQPSFRHIGIDEGLSQLSVQAIEEDTNGFVWVSTGDGLNKFEGNRITVYRHAYQDTTSLIDDKVNSIESTVDGSILAVTNEGISYYQPESDDFRTIRGTDRTHKCLDLRKCPHLIKDKSKWLLIAKRNLLALVNVDNSEKDTLSTDITANSFIVSDSTLYILSRSAYIYKVSKSFDDIELIFRPEFKCLASNMIIDNRRNFYISLEENGLLSYDVDTDTHRHYTTSNGLSSNLVRAMKIDDDGNLWIATGNNLTILNPDTGDIRICTHSNHEPESLSSASLKSIHKTSSGSMWIGTFYKGIDYYNPCMQSFHNIVLPESYWNHSEAIICNISADPEGYLWIGTSRSGIFRYYPQTSEFIPFRKTSVKEQALNAIAFHDRGEIVLFGCTYSGLSIFDKSSDRIIWRNNGESVFSIAQYTSDKYLIGRQHGIRIFDFNDMSMKKVTLPDDDGSRVYYLYTDSERNVWAGMEDWLYYGDLSSNDDGGYVFNIKEKHPDIRQVQDIIEIDGRVWFASRSGLFCYDKTTREWSVISDKDGISTNLIRGLEADTDGYIYAATDRSILFVDSATGSFQEYYSKDGLVNEKYNMYANTKTKDGTIWFGGTSGISYFKPQVKSLHATPETPFISDLYVNGERLLPANSDALSKPIYCSEEIYLKAGQNNISMILSNFEIFSKDRIEYMMEGIDKEWQRISSSSNTVSYTNVPPGDNIFRIRSVNILTGSFSPVKELTFHIRCHWYQSAAFIIIVCILILLSIFQFIFHVKKQSSHQIAEILNKAKIDIQTAKTSSYLTIQSMNRKRDIEFISKALSVVEDNISNDKFNIDIFAEQMNMSRSNLHIRIKSAYGASATHFIRRIRIEKAMEYLQEGKMNISGIAYSVGFSSATYFATAFKQVTGVNPTEWRQSLCQDSPKENK